jgi:hypothetical protein
MEVGEKQNNKTTREANTTKRREPWDRATAETSGLHAAGAPAVLLQFGRGQLAFSFGGW